MSEASSRWGGSLSSLFRRAPPTENILKQVPSSSSHSSDTQPQAPRRSQSYIIQEGQRTGVEPSGRSTSRSLGLRSIDSGLASVGSRAPDIDDYEHRPFNWKLTTLAAIGAFSGSLFGYDLGIIGTLSTVPGFTRFYNGDQSPSPPPPFSPAQVFPPPPPPPGGRSGGLVGLCQDAGIGLYLTISLFAAGMVGGLLGSLFNPLFGRRRTLMYAAAIYTAGTCIEATAYNVPIFYIGRAVMGIGVGLTNQVTPIYLAEISPAKNRGAIGISFQLAITFGILMATVVAFSFRFNSGISEENLNNTASSAWRFFLLVGASPGVVVMYTAVFLMETPQFIMGGDEVEGQEAAEQDAEEGSSAKLSAKALAYSLLRELRQTDNVDQEFRHMELYCDRRYSFAESWKLMFLDRRRVPPILTTTMLVVFQQITFLNGVLFFLPSLYDIGLEGSDALTSNLIGSLVNSVINFLATILAIYVSDRFGRRPLFLEAGVQLGVAALTMAGMIGKVIQAELSELTDAQVFFVIAIVEVYVSAYAWSWGPLPWTMPAELNAWPWRSAGTAFAVAVNFAVSMLVAGIFNVLLCAMQWGLFLVMALIVVLATTCAYLFFPETMDVDINETEFLFKGHWFWKRFYPEDEQIETLTRLRCFDCFVKTPDGPGHELGISGSIAEVPDAPVHSTVTPHRPFPTLTAIYGLPPSVAAGGSKLSSTTSNLQATGTVSRGMAAAGGSGGRAANASGSWFSGLARRTISETAPTSRQLSAVQMPEIARTTTACIPELEG
mmetsp:Transcript_22068/g.61249  ORF Transcript_22068/g.61249 Transcript_22068/m.61249 type:complete len:776 (-) Transcript_22068:11-2338(-)